MDLSDKARAERAVEALWVESFKPALIEAMARENVRPSVLLRALEDRIALEKDMIGRGRLN